MEAPRYPDEIREQLTDLRQRKSELESRMVLDAADQSRLRSFWRTEISLMEELAMSEYLLSRTV